MLANAHKVCPACKTRAALDALYCQSCGADIRSIEAAEGDPYLGLTIAGKYHIDALIGVGAMGRVYKAVQTTLNKPFAAKILAPHLMNDETSAARFAAEAHNCASLNHPNVVSVVDYGRTEDGVTYIVMEYIEGKSLEDIISQQFPLPRERIVDLALQTLAALSEAHGLGILHRDLKPENILVQSLRTHGELAKVLDFGIAKLMDRAEVEAQPGLTSAGMVCGTPEYMSPEQARGKTLDERSDIYAVGVILYQMLTGRPPFESASAVEILHMHLHDDPVPPSKVLGTDPDALEAVCLRALSKDPASRPTNAIEFREELLAATSTRPTQGDVIECHACGESMKPQHRFCPACGAPAPEREVGLKRNDHKPATGSGLYVPINAGQPTAEMVVRSFPLPFVGREHTFARVRTLLNRPHPSLRVRVLSGPRGVGKTRLSDELASFAESNGWRVYYVGSDPSGARVPLWPIRTIVSQILELNPETVTTKDLGRVANLCGLAFEELPGLAELFGLVGPAHKLEHAVRRRECFASAVQAILSGGRGNPLLLVFDDVDGFDGAAREVLRRLARAHTSAPVVMLVNTTESDADWLAGGVEVLEELDGDAIQHLGRIVTSNINKKHTRIFDQLSSTAPTSPLKLEATLRLMAVEGGGPVDAPESELIRRRVERLSDSQRQVLEAASVLGERVPESDLVDLLPLDESPLTAAQIDDALTQLHVQGFLLVLGHGERAFAHRVLQDVVYAAIHETRRSRLHSLAAEISVFAKRSIVARTVHLVRAGAPSGVKSLIDAAELAERSFDDAAAADLLQAATRLVVLRPPEELGKARQAELAVKASNVMRSAEQSRQAIALIDTELSRGHSPADEAGLLFAKGCQLSRLAKYEDGVDTLKKALSSAIAGGDRAMMLKVYQELGRVHARRSELQQSIDEMREGLDICTLGEGPRSATDLDMWRYLLRIAETYRNADNLIEARKWCEHALFQAERIGDRLGLLRAHAQMAWTVRDLRQLALAEQHLARALDEARHFGDRLTTAELLIERARARAARGRLTEAQRLCEEALRLARGIQWSAGVQHAERAIAMLTRKSPLPTSSGPAEQSGSFDRPRELR